MPGSVLKRDVCWKENARSQLVRHSVHRTFKGTTWKES